MRPLLVNAVLLSAMLAASGLALALRPTVKIADAGPKVNLETLIPRNFGDWRESQFAGAQIVDPQQKELLDKLYNQTLSRLYINSAGYAIMLSIAYGSDQSDALQVHKPEVCYPAQGFVLEKKERASILIGDGAVPVTRLLTTLGQRHEPITYWTTIGDQVVTGGVQKKLVEMSFGLAGRIPDGMLIRVSSVDRDSARAYVWHELFASQLVGAVPQQDKRRLVGAPAEK